MGFLSRLFGQSTPSIDVTHIASITNGPGTYNVDVIGESHYQRALNNICGGRTRKGHRFKTDAYLVPEANNPSDSTAVRIVIKNHAVGYLDRKTARRFHKMMAAAGYRNTTAMCPAIIVGGWDRGPRDKGYFGVRLDLPIAD